MTRLFVALNIPNEIKKKIIEYRDSLYKEEYQNKKIRWEPEDKLHITLKFIGEVEDLLVNKISGAINFIEEYKKINLEPERFGFFFKRKIPKILWLGFRADSSLFSLADRLNKEIFNISGGSVPVEEREFKAHLTLLRVRENIDKNFIKSFEEFKFPETKFNAENITLYKSELLPEKSRYTEIKKFNLK
jgi:2'-5' RNA ligase